MAHEKRRKCFEDRCYVEIHFLGECEWHRILHDWNLGNGCLASNSVTDLYFILGQLT